jgi:hypothetical protein
MPVGLDHDLLKVMHGLDEADAAHEMFKPALLNRLGADIEVAHAHGHHDVFDRHAVRAQQRPG